ncbi:hypothetical protein [Pseudomonas tolaasii]
MSSRILKNKAIKVLGGMHAYQHKSEDFRLLVDMLKFHVKNTKGGRLINLDGLPGCGVSTLMSALSCYFNDDSVKIEYMFCRSELTLLDQFAASIKLRSPHDRLDSMPHYLHAYVKATGLKYVIIDDLERFLISQDNFKSIVMHLQAISDCGDGLIVLYSTRDRALRNRLMSKGGIDPQHFCLRSIMTTQEVADISLGLFAAANSMTHQNISINNISRLEATHELARIDELVDFLESAYAHATLNKLKEINLNDYLFGLFSDNERNFTNLHPPKRQVL